jgi:hypothetical protein
MTVSDQSEISSVGRQFEGACISHEAGAFYVEEESCTVDLG